MAYPEGLPEADHPEWFSYNGPELPGDPKDMDQYIGAKRGLGWLMEIVDNCIENEIPITAEMVIDYCVAWSEEEKEAYPGFAFTVPNVLACSRRNLMNLAGFEIFDDRYHLSVATHLVLKVATVVHLMSDEDREMWQQGRRGELECYNCGDQLFVIPHLYENPHGELEARAVPWCNNCDHDLWDDSWNIDDEDHETGFPF